MDYGWGLPYWFRAALKSSWSEADIPTTAYGNTEWPANGEYFRIGFHCHVMGPDIVPGCYLRGQPQ